MGVYSVFAAVRSVVQASNPDVEFLFTAEAAQFQGSPPKIVWELPPIGGEDLSRQQLGPGYNASSAIGRQLWARRAACTIHIWMPSTGVDAAGVEYLDDNEDPNAGDVWLVQTFIAALHQVCAGQYVLGAGGFETRTMANLGWLYSLPVTLFLTVFDTGVPAATAEITTATITSVLEEP